MENYQVKSFDIFPYVKDKHDNVWKYISAKDHFIKISPWKDGEDRRVNRFQIEQKINKGELVQYSNKQGIKQIINERWDKEDREWDFNGDHFVVSPRMNDNDFYKAKVHKFIHTYKDQNGEEHEYSNNYRIVFFNGKIVWANPWHYWPQGQIYTFKAEDIEPDMMHSGYQWTKGYHLRPIYSCKRQEYI